MSQCKICSGKGGVSCGGPLIAGARFCKQCGTAAPEGQAQSASGSSQDEKLKVVKGLV
jgi:hypothetical protein